MKVFSQLEKAQLENTTADVGSLAKGSATYRTDLNIPKVSNGTVMKEVIMEDSTQTLSNKTLASPVVTTDIKLNAQAIAKFYDSDSSNFMGFRAPSTVTADKTLNLPDGVGSSGQFLQTNGVDTLAWAAPAAISASSIIENLGLSFSVGASALTINLKQADAATDPTAGSPVRIGFRSTTAGSGLFNVRSATAATSIVIPSGATLGLNSGTAAYIYVYAIDNAGTIELAVNGAWLPDTDNTTTTLDNTIDTASFSTVSSTTSRSSVPIRMIARIKYNTAPNGTYSAVPDGVVLGDAQSLKIAGSPENVLITNTSSIKTPTATSNYSNMTNNDLTLQPGVWRLHAEVFFNASGAAGYSGHGLGWYGSDGADSASVPTLLPVTTGISSIETAYVGSGSGATPSILLGNGLGSTAGLVAPTTIIKVDRTTIIYAVPFASMSTPANARISVAASAERIS